MTEAIETSGESLGTLAWDTLEGVVDTVVFFAEESGYTVLKLQPPYQEDTFNVVGVMPENHPGETISLKGQWIQHPKYGRQFKAEQCIKKMPATISGLEKYLASGLIKGVGPSTAKKMIQTFGVEIVNIIEKEPDKLKQIALIGPKKQAMIVESWKEHKEIQNIMIFLQEHGISTAFGVKIFKQYGNRSLDVVKKNPYQLTQDIWGVGFKTADQLARALGLDPHSAARVQAGLLFTLQQANLEGHVYLPENELMARAQTLLKVPQELLPQALTELSLQEDIVLGGDAEEYVYLSAYWQAEQGICHLLGDLLATEDPVEDDTWHAWLEEFQATQALELSQEQTEALQKAAASKVFILTGGPGTGKTTICKGILEWFQDQNQDIALASPTGRAAKRLSEVTGQEASTIHRLLEFDPKFGRFQRDQYEPLDIDVLLLDEISMVDTLLFFALLKALPPEARLILVGDSDQLPSVGAGAILKELLLSEHIPSKVLTQVFRQAQSSTIITNAHRVNQGEMPELFPPRGKYRTKDAFFMRADTPEAVQTQLIQLLTERLPKAGHKPHEIQVLCPMNRGNVGTQVLNACLQQALNPPSENKAEFSRGQRLFREGDRMIQLKNNYDELVYNGDLGVLSWVKPEEQDFGIDFGDTEVTYDFSDSDQVQLSYAMTIHKSQGSEFPVVILVLMNQHHIMLQRNLLYTGMTRAKKLLILMGQSQAIERAVAQSRLRERHTQLSAMLRASKH